MGKAIFIAALAATALLATSCDKDKLETGKLSTESDVICFPSGGGSYDITLTSDSPWTTVSLHDWVTVTPESGNNSSIVTINVDKWNNENNEVYRSAKVVFLNDTDTLNTYIEQRNDDNLIMGPPFDTRPDTEIYNNTLYISNGDSATAPAQGGDIVFNIVADCSWWIECDASWLTISPAREWGSEKVTVNVGAWEDAGTGEETSRTAELRIGYKKSPFVTDPIYCLFTVTQTSSN